MAMGPLGGMTFTSGTVFLTVPAGNKWIGTISVTAAVTVASGGAAVKAAAWVTIAGGADCTPAPGDYLRVDLNAPASLLAAVGTNDSNAVHTNICIIAGASPATLTLNTSNTTTQSANAMGRLS